MITGLSSVSARNRFRSDDMRHGKPPSRPITPFSAAATMIAMMGSVDMMGAAIRLPQVDRLDRRQDNARGLY